MCANQDVAVSNVIDNTSVSVLFGVLTNLLRFHESYARILHGVGVLESLLLLFQSQTLRLPASEAGVVKIAYPTSPVRLGAVDYMTAEYLAVSESSLRALLESHCRQVPDEAPKAAVTGKGALLSSRDFTTLVDVLIVFAEEAHHSSSDIKDEDKQDLYTENLCSSETLECVCALIASEEFRDAALLLWSRILRLALTFKRQNTSVYNAVNCVLQSIRSAALSISHHDGVGVHSENSASPESQRVLRVVLGALEGLVRPPEARDIASLFGDPAGTCSSLGSFSTQDRDRVVSAMIDCGAVNASLAVLCELTAARRSSEDANKEVITIASLAMRLIHLQIVHNKNAGQEFSR